MVGRDGFEPPKAKPADLQSAPFGHSGTYPFYYLFTIIYLSRININMNSDQKEIGNLYSLVLEEQQLMHEYEMLHEQSFEELFQDLTDAILAPLTDTAQKAVQTVSDISNYPELLSKYLSGDLSKYIDALSTFISNALSSGASGAVVTAVVGKLIMMLAKKIGADSTKNNDIMKTLLPQEVQAQLSALEELRQTNPQEYRVRAFNINKQAMVELEKTLNSAGIRTRGGLLQRTINFVGKFLFSTTGSIAGGIAIAYLIHKLGFNPMPIFPISPQP